MSWYAIKHYEEFENDEWDEVKTIDSKVNGKYKRKNNSSVMSFDLIYYMFNSIPAHINRFIYEIMVIY